MIKLSRYILILIAVFTLAVFLPRFYWLMFEKPVRKPFVQYSCVKNDFMIQRIHEKKWEDTKGNSYTQEEYEQSLPLMYTKQLLASGTMVDSVNGVPLKMKDIATEKSFFRLKANEVDAPFSALYPMFESMSGRAKLDLPDDFFRITWRIEFIDAATNTILEEKSQLFSAALFHFGFKFPAKRIFGIATPRKSCDEGYLIIDSNDQLFHLKMVKGKPFVKKVELPAGVKFKHISCVDLKNKAFYAYLFSTKNEIYILTQNDYKLIKWPVEDYDQATCDLKIYGDMFNYNAVIEANGYLKVVALNKDYQLVDTYSEKWLVKEDMKSGKIFASIFPFTFSMTSNDSNFIRFYFNLSNGFNWLILNVLFAVFHFGWVVWKKKKIKENLIDLLIVAISGIYGFFAIHLFRNKFLD